MQRHCSQFTRNFNFPLGGLIVRDFNSVIAPVGDCIYPRGLDHKDNELLMPVLKGIDVNYEAMIRLYNKPK